MGDSKAYILVKCNVPVRTDSECITQDDLKRNFYLRVNGILITPEYIYINHPNFPDNQGDILFELRPEDVPDVNDRISVRYIKRTPCNIVHKNVSDELARPLKEFHYASDTHPEVVTPVSDNDRPQVIDVDTLNSDGGRVIYLTFTEFRNLENSTNFGNFRINVTPNPNGTYDNVEFSNIGELEEGKIKFTAFEGAIEKGSTYDILYNGQNVRDQHSLELKSFLTSPVPCKNSIENLVFHSASVDTERPNKITVSFKNPTTSALSTLKNNLSEPYLNDLSSYKYFINNTGELQNALSVQTVNGSNNIIVLEYTTQLPLKHTDEPCIIWDSKIETKEKVLQDEFGNNIFSSEFDPLSGLNTSNDKSILIENRINGIAVEESSLVASSSNVLYNIPISFKRLNTDESVSIFTNNVVSSDFVLFNKTTNNTFSPDGVTFENGSLNLFVNYNSDSFSKIVNKNDEMELNYVNTNWPSSIRDSFNNYMLAQSNLSVNTDNILYGGKAVMIREVTEDTFKVVVEFDNDICGNSIDLTDFSITSAAVVDIAINNIEQLNANTLLVSLNKDPGLEAYLSLNNASLKNKFGIFIEPFENVLITKYLQIEKIDAVNESAGKEIYITFPEDRNITNSVLTGFSVNVTSNPNGTNNAVFNTIGSFVLDKPNQIKLTVTSGNIQTGDQYDIAYTSTGDNNIVDQKGFFLKNFATAPVTCENSVLNPVFGTATVETQNPRKVVVSFKNPQTNESISLRDNSNWPYDNNIKSYYLFKKSGETFLDTNFSNIDSELMNGQINLVYNLNEPINYNDQIGVAWNYNASLQTTLPENLQIADSFGNVAFNSIYDVNNVMVDGFNMISVTNNIDGIKINDTNLILQFFPNSHYELNVAFKRINSLQDIPCELENVNLTDFVISNKTTGSVINPTEITNNTGLAAGTIKIKVDVTSLEFDDIINKNDNLTLQYVGVSTVKDTFGNYLLAGNELTVQNNSQYFGSVVRSYVDNNLFDKLNIEFDVDICGNTISKDYFLVTDQYSVVSAELDENNSKVIVLTINDILNDNSTLINLLNSHEIKNSDGLTIFPFLDLPIDIDSMTITNIKTESNNGGKIIEVTFHPSRNISNSNLDEFNVSVTPNPNGTYDQDEISFIALAEYKSSNSILLRASSGQIQSGSTYNISYNGTEIKDQYDSLLQPFSIAPVECENLVKTPVFERSFVPTNSPNKIYSLFKTVTIIENILLNNQIVLDRNMDDGYNNSAGAYNCMVNGENVNVIKVSTEMGIGNKIYLVYELENNIKNTDTVKISWDMNNENLPIYRRIRDEDLNEVFSSIHDDSSDVNGNVSVQNNISNIIFGDNLAASLINNKLVINLDFKRENFGSEDFIINSLPAVNEFTINKNGMTNFNPSSITINNNLLSLHIDYDETDFTNTLNKTDNIAINYIGNTITDQFGNRMAQVNNVFINNLIELSGNFISGISYRDSKKIILNFDVDICGNTVDVNDFTVNINTSEVELSSSNIIGQTIELITKNDLVGEEDILTITLNSNHAIKNTNGLLINTFSSLLSVLENPERLYIGNNNILYVRQEIDIINKEFYLNQNKIIKYKQEFSFLEGFTSFTSLPEDSSEYFLATDTVKIPANAISYHMRLRFVITNQEGVVEDEFISNTVRILSNTNPIVINTIEDQNIYINEPFTFTIPENTFRDNDGDSVITSLESDIPAWMTYNNSTKTFSGTPLVIHLGTVEIMIRGSDGKGGFVDLIFYFVVERERVNSDTTGEITIELTDETLDITSIFLTEGKTYKLVTNNTFNDAEGIGSINYGWKKVGANGPDSMYISLDDELTIDSSLIGWRIQLWATVLDNEGVLSQLFKSNITGIVRPLLKLSNNGQTITDANFIPNLGRTNLSIDLGDEQSNMENFSYQWTRDNIDISGATLQSYQLDTEDTGTTIAAKVMFDTISSDFTGLLTFANNITQPVQDNRAKIININVLDGNQITDASGINNISVNTGDTVKLELVFNKQVQVETTDASGSIPDINVQIGGQGQETDISSSQEEFNEFENHYRDSAVFSGELTEETIDGITIFKSQLSNSMIFKLTSDKLGLVEFYGSTGNMINTKEDRLLSIGLEGSTILDAERILLNLDLVSLLSERNISIRFNPDSTSEITGLVLP